jgi:hypothetical protein
MKKHRNMARLAFILVLAAVAILSVVKVGRASGPINTENLQGAWQAAIIGFGGCANETIKVNFTLDDTGHSTNATLVAHAGGVPPGPCSDNTLTGQTFTITALDSHGSGTAGLSCGPGCGFTFEIQVAPNREVFNLVDVTDPRNFWEGTAIHQSHHSTDD